MKANTVKPYWLQIIIETKWDSYDKEFESSEENDTAWPILKSSDICEKIDKFRPILSS